MPFLNEHLKNIKPYKLVSQRAWEDPDAALKLDWNESTVPPSPLVLDRALAAFQTNRLHWYPNIANASLNQKLAKYCRVESANILYFASSDSAHEAICRTYLGPEDVALAIAPTYDNFRLTVETVGARFLPINCYNETFELDLDAFDAAIRSHKPKLAYVCNPNNPTGFLIPSNLVIELTKRHPNTLFLLDEAYIEFHPDSVSESVASHENLIVSRTMSKAFGLAGFRFGYLVASVKRALELSVVRNPKNVSTFAQIAAEAALDDVAHMEAYVWHVTETRTWLHSEISRRFEGHIKPFPSNANFILLKFESPRAASAFTEKMAANNIYVRGLSHLKELESHVRLTIGTREQMEYFLTVAGTFF